MAASSVLREGDARRRRLAGHHLPGEVRTAQDSNRIWGCIDELLRKHFGHPLVGTELDAFGDADDDRSIRKERSGGRDRASKVLGRHGNHDELDVPQRLLEIVGDYEIVGEAEPRPSCHLLSDPEIDGHGRGNTSCVHDGPPSVPA
jgi:hypothetical protein